MAKPLKKMHLQKLNGDSVSFLNIKTITYMPKNFDFFHFLKRDVYNIY